MAFQFPDPSVTPEFTGANGITYIWDATDGKWVVKGFAAESVIGPCASSSNTICDQITELEEELDALAPSVERGVWVMNLNGNVSNRGQLTMYDDVFGQGSPIGIFQQAKSVWFNQEDTDGTPHGFSNVEPGYLLQLFVEGEDDYGLFEVVTVHDQTAPPSSYYAIDVEFVRALSATSKADPSDRVRMKTFQAPQGGDAGEFVLKIGDQMTGELEFYTEQADNTQDFGIPAANAQDLRFTTKRLDTGNTNATHLYKAGYGNYLVSSGALMARGNIYTASSIYGTYFNSDGSTVIKNPRIYLTRVVDSGTGDVTSEYGALRWGGTNIVRWDDASVEISNTPLVLDPARATEDNHAIHKGYIDKVIQATGLQLGNFTYRRSGDSFTSGHIRSNASTNPASITRIDLHQTNTSTVTFGKQFYMDVIKNKMYLHFKDKNTGYYVGRITGIDELSYGVRLTLTPITSLIEGSVYYNNQYDVFISYNMYGYKYG